MHALRAADETHRCDAVAVARKRIMRSLEYRGMVRQSQVIIGAEIDHLASVRKRHHGALCRTDDALALEQSRDIQSVGVALKSLTKFLQHGVLVYLVRRCIRLL